jgi:hypothetical protein
MARWLVVAACVLLLSACQQNQSYLHRFATLQVGDSRSKVIEVMQVEPDPTSFIEFGGIRMETVSWKTRPLGPTYTVYFVAEHLVLKSITDRR